MQNQAPPQSIPPGPHPAIPTHERLIVALDVPDSDAARQLVSTLGDSVSFYKIGLELLMGDDYWLLLHWLTQVQGKKVFADLKLHDVPATVARAVRRLNGHPIELLTVHSYGEMVAAAVKAAQPSLKLLAVTVLTSMDQTDLVATGCDQSPQQTVLIRAKTALSAGAHGVVASGQEAALLRQELGPDFMIVTPGIRAANATSDDQKRTVTAAEAITNGASYIVVGRPIKNADDPRAAALAIQAQIAQACAPN